MNQSSPTTPPTLPEQGWAAHGFDRAERERWLARGLGFGDAVIASRSRDLGLSPDDLKLLLDGETVASRLRAGEDVTTIAAQVHDLRHRLAVGRLDRTMTTEVIGVDGRPETDTDRMLQGLQHLLTGYILRPIVIRADSLRKRYYVDGNGEALRFVGVGIGTPPLHQSGLTCQMHGSERVAPLPGPATPRGPGCAVGFQVCCADAVLNGIRAAISAAEEEPVPVTVDGERLNRHVRETFDDACVPVVYGRATLSSRDDAALTFVGLRRHHSGEEQVLSVQDVFFAEPLPRPRKTRSRSATPGLAVLPKWSGFPKPPACRAVTKAVLSYVDDAITVDPTELAAYAASLSCPAHPDPDLEGLLADTAVLTKAEGRVRLTRAGEKRSDALHNLSAGFRFSPRVYRHQVLYAWQGEALQAWAEHGRFGVIEAVTGTGRPGSASKPRPRRSATA